MPDVNGKSAGELEMAELSMCILISVTLEGEGEWLMVGIYDETTTF